jgi:hypothetical protein
MFNPQLGQALLEVIPSEVSSSIAYQNSQGTEARENHTLDHCNGLFYESFTTWHGLYPLGHIIKHD